MVKTTPELMNNVKQQNNMLKTSKKDVDSCYYVLYVYYVFMVFSKSIVESQKE